MSSSNLVAKWKREVDATFHSDEMELHRQGIARSNEAIAIIRSGSIPVGSMPPVLVALQSGLEFHQRALAGLQVRRAQEIRQSDG